MMPLRFPKFFLYIFTTLLIIVVFRIFYIVYVMDSIKLQNKNELQRGYIFDRNGNLLSASEETYNIYINNNKKTKLPLKKITEITQVDIKWTNQLNKNQVFLLKRYLSKDRANQLKQLNISSLLFEKALKRNRPYGNSLSHTLGLVDINSIGVSGIEKSMDDQLASINSPPRSIVTTIDIRLQLAIEEQLNKTLKEFEADKGFVIVQDIESGNIVSLASSPSLDYHNLKKEIRNNLVNPNVSVTIEPGSIMKVFFIAYLIEQHLYSLETTFNCSGQINLISAESIKCSASHGDINFSDIMKYSCNSAIIQATDKLTRREIHNFLYHCQFGKITGIRLPYEAKGVIPPPRDWGIRTTATIPIGHGIETTPIQLLSSFCGLLNGGLYRKPRIIDKVIERDLFTSKTNDLPYQLPVQIFTSSTSKTMINLLGYGTKKQSTGRKAAYGEYTPIGKTGTSQLIDLKKGGYLTNSYNAMFIGAFPEDKPKFACLVIVNNPKHSHYGGKVAAPLFSKLLPELFSAYSLNQGIPSWLLDKNLNPKYFHTDFKNHLMPDLTGKSLRDALVIINSMRKVFKAKDLSFDLKIEGQGYVVEQLPKANDFVKHKSTVHIILK